MKGIRKGKYKGAPLVRIDRVVCDEHYVRTGFYFAILVCGHTVRRFGYVRRGTLGGPSGAKTKRCHCIKCKENLPADDLPLDAFDAGKVVVQDEEEPLP